jgi:hypothetical protein
MQTCSESEDKAAREVAAMQFAGGSSIESIAEHWERDAEWVAKAIREALLKTIPQRDGGLKLPRAALRAREAQEERVTRETYTTFNW